MPATAICWSTYEFAKFVLSRKSREDYQSSITTIKTKDVITDKVRIDEAKLGLRYVLPTTSVSAADSIDDQQSTVPSSVREPPSIKPRELPSISATGVYSTALNLNTMHTDTHAGRNFDRGCSR